MVFGIFRGEIDVVLRQAVTICLSVSELAKLIEQVRRTGGTCSSSYLFC